MVVRSLVGPVSHSHSSVSAACGCSSKVGMASPRCANPVRGDTSSFSFKYGEARPAPNLPGSTQRGSLARHSASHVENTHQMKEHEHTIQDCFLQVGQPSTLLQPYSGSDIRQNGFQGGFCFLGCNY